VQRFAPLRPSAEAALPSANPRANRCLQPIGWRESRARLFPCDVCQLSSNAFSPSTTQHSVAGAPAAPSVTEFAPATSTLLLSHRSRSVPPPVATTSSFNRAPSSLATDTDCTPIINGVSPTASIPQTPHALPPRPIATDQASKTNAPEGLLRNPKIFNSKSGPACLSLAC
jgi:hypothetical protein